MIISSKYNLINYITKIKNCKYLFSTQQIYHIANNYLILMRNIMMTNDAKGDMVLITSN